MAFNRGHGGRLPGAVGCIMGSGLAESHTGAAPCRAAGPCRHPRGSRRQSIEPERMSVEPEDPVAFALPDFEFIWDPSPSLSFLTPPLGMSVLCYPTAVFWKHITWSGMG